jgi:uncharacterized peroxidase-related enzyme
VVHHGAGLRTLTGRQTLSRALATDHRTAELTEADRAMLDYAVKLTRTPAAIGEPDIRELRHAGFSNAAVLDICQVVSYYNYVNRLADGLGVELEDFWAREELTMTREEFDAACAQRRASGQGGPEEGA